MREFILAHDVGTSSSKAVLLDFSGKIIAQNKVSFTTYYPRPSFVEQSPKDYWLAVCQSTQNILSDGISPDEIKAVIFSTQSMGIIPVDENGITLYNNITWADGRAERQAQKIMRKFGGKRLFTMLSGTPIMGKDVLAKIVWLKEEHPEIYQNTKYFLDVNGYLKYKCTGKMVTEWSGASSYGFDLKKKDWLSVLKFSGLDTKKLPPLVKSTDIVGSITSPQAKKAD